MGTLSVLSGRWSSGRRVATLLASLLLVLVPTPAGSAEDVAEGTSAVVGGLGAEVARLAMPLAEGGMTPSDTCGSCHRDIYKMWRKSAHSRSMENPVFLNAYHDTQRREGHAVSAICLDCHAPAAAVNDDREMNRRESWEGVSCDFCHSLVSVDLSGKGPRHSLDVGDVKRGPIRDADSNAHQVAYSELHEISLGCAGCHEYANAEGTSILATYSEWQESSAARSGTECQNCHMAVTRARVVDPRVKRVAHAEVNLHEVPGGHSLEQLHRALRVSIDPDRQDGQLGVDIGLTNKGAGHAVPTGMPGRRVILAVEVRTTGGATFDERRFFERTFVDAEDEPITRDGGYFSPGVREVADTRLRPDEERHEQFDFPVPAGDTAYITVRLHYEHRPTEDEADWVWLTFYSEKRVMVPASGDSG